ncbi:hypothetical protein LWI28_004886 [Acer negundo]|uniref:Peroxidase n=1 Tax=Acer negundo TaxID=4023 RepID=A0AAD5JJA6_ACENE|nr:hypothetical protein LWI28_004886 [Acer negundo]
MVSRRNRWKFGLKLRRKVVVTGSLAMASRHAHWEVCGEREVCEAGNGRGRGRRPRVRVDELRMNFYKDSCPKAEDIVKKITWSRIANNPGLSAKLLRMHYHDCFVTSKKPKWEVRTGRKDGRVSLASQVSGNLPSPFANFSGLMQVFTNKGLDKHDLVTLSAAHTVGVAHCGIFSRRLYNFTGNGDADPSLDATYADFLRSKCPNPADPSITVEMDPQSSLSFDKSYFTIVLQNKGLFISDAALLTDPIALNTLKRFQETNAFFSEFSDVMMRMGAMEVLTGNEGEIRKKCSIVN